MIKHIVMWKLKDSAKGVGKKENAQRMKKEIEALKDKIEQIIHIEVGFNFNNSEAAHDVVLYSEFASKEDLQVYQQHPEHMKLRLKEELSKIKTSADR